MNYPTTDPEQIAHAINAEIAATLWKPDGSQNIPPVPADLVCPSDWLTDPVYPPVENAADLRALAIEWLSSCVNFDELTTVNRLLAWTALDILTPAEGEPIIGTPAPDPDAAARALVAITEDVDIQAEQEQGYSAMIGRSLGGRP